MRELHRAVEVGHKISICFEKDTGSEWLANVPSERNSPANLKSRLSVSASIHTFIYEAVNGKIVLTA